MADYQKREAKAVSAIKKAIPMSLRQNLVKFEGMFADLFENNEVFPRHFLACAIDGVGTKLIVAEAMQKYDTVGIDLVAMSANDLATLGKVSPFLFIDYFAVQEKFEEEGLTGDLMKGIVKGLEQCDASSILRNSIKINIGKGETASVDELISSFRPGYGFDIAGGMIGFIEKDKVKTNVKISDKIIAFPSSGPHSNGFTDLRLHLLKGEYETRSEFRKNYKGRFKLDDNFDGSTIGKRLLEPTRIYVKDIAKTAKNFDIIGVNNTGYGLKNFNRLKGKFEFFINNPLKPQPIFQLMQKESKFSDKEMYQRFNMGMGFFVIVNKDDAGSIGGEIVGEVRRAEEERTVLVKDGKKIVFEGY